MSTKAYDRAYPSNHTFKTPDEALEAVRKALVDAADFGP